MDAPHAQLAATLADTLERTMRDVGAWSEPAPPRLPFRLPFAMDSMPFEHWLQLVLVPRMREIAATAAPLPMRSGLAAHAVREFDGRDDLTPLVDVLRAIDDACPPPPSATAHDARRLGAGVALIGLVTLWGIVAVVLSQRLTPVLALFFHATITQTFVGSVPPGNDFHPLRITVTAIADDDGTIRTTDASLLVLRSMRTMTRGPTAPFDFTMNERPTNAAVLEWLGDFGVDAHADPAHTAATEALLIVDAAARARTADALHSAAAEVATHANAEDLLRSPHRTPEWAELTLLVGLILAGAGPILFGVLRASGRR